MDEYSSEAEPDENSALEARPDLTAEGQELLNEEGGASNKGQDSVNTQAGVDGASLGGRQGKRVCTACDREMLDCTRLGHRQEEGLPLRSGFWMAAFNASQSDVRRCPNEDACQGTSETSTAPAALKVANAVASKAAIASEVHKYCR